MGSGTWDPNEPALRYVSGATIDLYISGSKYFLYIYVKEKIRIIICEIKMFSSLESLFISFCK